MSALVVRPDGQALPQAVNWQPFETRYPITCWRPDQRIVETRRLPLAQDSPPGAYWISLSAFERHSGQIAITPVSITRPGAAPETQIGLGPIERR